MSSGEKLDGVTCKLANKEASKFRKLDSTYAPHMSMMDNIKPVLKQIFKMSENQLKNLTFNKMTSYSDNIIANVFEGITLNHKFSQQEMYQIMQSVQFNLVKPYSNTPSIEQMYSSRYLQRP